MYLLLARQPAPAAGEGASNAVEGSVPAKHAARLEDTLEREARQELPHVSSSKASARIVFGSTIDESDVAAPSISLALEEPGESPLKALSDRDGTFVFHVRQAGRFRLTAIDCPGYIPASLFVDLLPEESSVRADLRLRRVNEIPVRVLDLQGYDFWKSYRGPLALGSGAVICTRRPITSLPDGLAGLAGESGLARFRPRRESTDTQADVPGEGFIGLLEPHVEPPYFATLVCCSEVWASQEVTVAPKELIFRVDAASKPELGSIRVRFRDARTSRLVSRLQFGLCRPGGPRFTELRVADADGYFSVEKLPAKRMILFLANNPENGFESLTVGFDVIANTLVDLGEFTLQTERNDGRRGVVLDEKGAPIPDLEVRIDHLDPNGKPSGMYDHERTDGMGRFQYALHASGGLVHLCDREWVSVPLRCEYTAPVDVPIELHATRGISCRLAAAGAVEEVWGIQLRDSFGFVVFEGTLHGGSEAECKLATGRYELSVLTPEGQTSSQPLQLGPEGARVELPH